MLLLLAIACDPDSTSTDTGEAAFPGVLILTQDVWHGTDGTIEAVDRDPYEEAESWSLVYPDGTRMEPTRAVAGRVEFEGAEEGPYTLWRVGLTDEVTGIAGRITVDESEARLWTLAYPRVGRSDVEVLTQPTPVTLSLTGMSPFMNVTCGDDGCTEAQDSITVASFDADAFAGLTPQGGDDAFTNPPSTGATSLDAFSFDWQRFGSSYNVEGPPRVLASDTTVVGHLAARVHDDPSDTSVWGHAVWSGLAEAATVSLDLTDGAPASVSGTFAALDQTTVTLGVADVDAMYGTAEAEAVGEFASVEVSREPGAPTPVVGISPTLARLSVSGSGPIGAGTVELSFGNPYVTGSTRGSLVWGRSIRLVHPTAGTNEAITESLSMIANFDGDTVSIEPVVGPPGAVLLGGAPFPTSHNSPGVGLTPILSWTAPTVGTPTYYSVDVRLLDDVLDDGGNLLSSRHIVARLTTRNTTLTLPEGILVAGGTYTVTVSAIVDGERETSEYLAVQGSASRAAGVFAP